MGSYCSCLNPQQVNQTANEHEIRNFTNSKPIQFAYIEELEQEDDLENEVEVFPQKSIPLKDKNGEGTYEYPDGSVYTGNFKNGMREGFGRLQWSPEEYYEGDFLMNMRHGKGKMVYSKDESYSGDWANDLYHGKGAHRMQDGSIFIGQFANGLRQGKGMVKHAKLIERGTWVDGLKQK